MFAGLSLFKPPFPLTSAVFNFSLTANCLSSEEVEEYLESEYRVSWGIAAPQQITLKAPFGQLGGDQAWTLVFPLSYPEACLFFRGLDPNWRTLLLYFGRFSVLTCAFIESNKCTNNIITSYQLPWLVSSQVCFWYGLIMLSHHSTCASAWAETINCSWYHFSSVESVTKSINQFNLVSLCRRASKCGRSAPSSVGSTLPTRSRAAAPGSMVKLSGPLSLSSQSITSSWSLKTRRLEPTCQSSSSQLLKRHVQTVIFLLVWTLAAICVENLNFTFISLSLSSHHATGLQGCLWEGTPERTQDLRSQIPPGRRGEPYGRLQWDLLYPSRRRSSETRSVTLTSGQFGIYFNKLKHQTT